MKIKAKKSSLFSVFNELLSRNGYVRVSGKKNYWRKTWQHDITPMMYSNFAQTIKEIKQISTSSENEIDYALEIICPHCKTPLKILKTI